MLSDAGNATAYAWVALDCIPLMPPLNQLGHAETAEGQQLSIFVSGSGVGAHIGDFVVVRKQAGSKG